MSGGIPRGLSLLTPGKQEGLPGVRGGISEDSHFLLQVNKQEAPRSPEGILKRLQLFTPGKFTRRNPRGLEVIPKGLLLLTPGVGGTNKEDSQESRGDT